MYTLGYKFIRNEKKKVKIVHVNRTNISRNRKSTKLNSNKATEIRNKFKQGISIEKIADEYKIGMKAIREIITRETWNS